MRFSIRNRWTGAVQLTAEIECSDDAPPGIKVGLAVKWAYRSGAVLYGADLHGADLYGADLHGADLHGADLHGADLHGADLRDADLRGAVLHGAVLHGAVLHGADLRDADPSEFVVPSLHRRMLAAFDAGGTLEMKAYHTCAKTHCRAGWAVRLAGSMGAALEFGLGTNAAAALIHVASCPELNGKVPDFFASNEDAMADIKRLAEMEPELEAVVA